MPIKAHGGYRVQPELVTTEQKPQPEHADRSHCLRGGRSNKAAQSKSRRWRSFKSTFDGTLEFVIQKGKKNKEKSDACFSSHSSRCQCFVADAETSLRGAA